MATKAINEMILLKVKENGIVNLINEYIPDKYLVITEDSRLHIPIIGKILYEDEVKKMLNIKIINESEKKILKYLHIYLQKVKPYKKYEFIISDVAHSQTNFVELESTIEEPSFEIKCKLEGIFQPSNMPNINQEKAKACGRCLDHGCDSGFYHIDWLYPCEIYDMLCQECNGNQFCDCDDCIGTVSD